MSPLANATVQAPTAPQPLAGPEVPVAPQLPSPFDAVAAGQIPLVALPPMQPDQPALPEQQFIIDNIDNLEQVGLGLYEAADLSTLVFNVSQVNPETLAEADAAGTLPQLIQTISQPAEAAPQASAAAPQDIAQARADQRPQMPVQTAPAVPSMPAPKQPAGTANLLAQARVRNMGAGPQTPGVKPNPLAGSVARRPV